MNDRSKRLEILEGKPLREKAQREGELRREELELKKAEIAQKATAESNQNNLFQEMMRNQQAMQAQTQMCQQQQTMLIAMLNRLGK